MFRSLTKIVVTIMILTNKRFKDIQKNILQDLYNKLVNRSRVVEEDKKKKTKLESCVR